MFSLPIRFLLTKVEKIFLISGGVFNKTIIQLALVGHEMIRDEARSAELVIHHLISNERSWNNC